MFQKQLEGENPSKIGVRCNDGVIGRDGEDELVYACGIGRALNKTVVDIDGNQSSSKIFC